MQTVLIAVIEFDLVLSGILFLCTVLKWFFLKARIEKNGWENMNPCDMMTLLVYAIPVFGQMCFLAVMTLLDFGAGHTREEAGGVIDVVIGPMRYVFDDKGKKQEG